MLANLRALLGVIVDIILLRRGPEHVPVSQGLLIVVVALSIAGSLLMAQVFSIPSANPLLESLVGSAVTLLWFHFALVFAGKRERFTQTMTAIFGVNTLFLPVVIPLLNALLPYLAKPDPNTPPPAALLIVTFIVGMWGFVVQMRIVRAAFECPWVGAVLLVFGEFFAAGFVSMLLFGTPPQGG